MGQIFISYRRSDASGHAGRLRDRLRAHFGEDIVFQDVDNIPDGEEFAKVIEHALDSCSVALVVMGRNWVNAESTRGVRRFDDPDDWVRTEVGILLRRGIRVVPVLVQGASMPRREDLPEELRDLAGRNARELRDSAWDADMSLLLKSLEPVLGFSRERRRKRNVMIAAGIAVVAIAGLMYAGLNVNIRVGEILVPDLEGKTVEMAREALTRDGFKNVRVETVPSTDFGQGRVVRTDPVASTSIASTDQVTVFVSGGGAERAAPSGQDPAARPAPSSVPEKGDISIKRPVTSEGAASPTTPARSALATVDNNKLVGRWKIAQRSPDGLVTEGVMRLVTYSVDGEFRGFGGTIEWASGEIKHMQSPKEIVGDRITFTFLSRDGAVTDSYTAVLDANRRSMVNGTMVSSHGRGATWTATRNP